MSRVLLCATIAWLLAGTSRLLASADLLPALSQLKPDRPRLLLRPERSRFAPALEELRKLPHDLDWTKMLVQLREEKSASAQAMVWLLSGDTNAAAKAIESMRSYKEPNEVDTFHVYFTLTQFALAYDWLCASESFTAEQKAQVRKRVRPLAERGLQMANDHVFHNYVWMSAGGAALWALATAGDDAEADQLYEQVRERFNLGLFPAWKYLDGLPSEPMGYWALYVFSPGVLTLLAAQSASEIDLVAQVQHAEGDWLRRELDNLIQSTLPDMRYIPWGDLQSGPNGGVTRDVAGVVDALTWTIQSRPGAFFGNWLAAKRGLGRFRGDTGIFYFLYTRNLQVAAETPPLSFVAGNKQGGHFIARSGWGDGDTVVAFTCTDHFGDHHHYDQGSFTIYRNGLLAVDPPVYNTVRGPQQPTEVHNTLLIGGQGQRPVRGQWFQTLAQFERNLKAGRQLETGDLTFWTERGTWAAVAGQFAQAYSPERVQSCVRQLLFVRPDKVIIVDQITAPGAHPLAEVEWLLQLPNEPTVELEAVWAANGQSWIRCRPLFPGGSRPELARTAVGTQRLTLAYRAEQALKLVHLIEVGDGKSPSDPGEAKARLSADGIEVSVSGSTYHFASQPPFEVTPSRPF